MNNITGLILSILLLSFSAPSQADDCSDFGNNHYMKWIDLDASCISKADLVKKIDAEGIWELTNREQLHDSPILLKKRNSPNTQMEINYLSFGDHVTTQLMLTFNMKCSDVLRGLESVGFPPFSTELYEFTKSPMFYTINKIENTVLSILPGEQPGYCANLTLQTNI